MEGNLSDPSRRDAMAKLVAIAGATLLSGCASAHRSSDSIDISDLQCADDQKHAGYPSLVDSLALVDETICVYANAVRPDAMWGEVLSDAGVASLRDLVRDMESRVFDDGFQERVLGILAYISYALLYRRRRQETDYLAGFCSDIASPWRVALLQRQYTLSHLFCTTTSAWDDQRQTMVMMRSLDWPLASSLGHATRKLKFIAEGRPATVAGIVGMVGVLTAVRQGYSVAINYAPGNFSARLNADPTFLLRDLIESPNVESYDQALTAILGWNVGAPCFVSLCGVRHGEACVVEFGPGDRPYVRNIANGVLVQTNHYDPNGPYAKSNIPQIHLASNDEGYCAKLLMTSVQRQKMVEESLHEASDIREALCNVYQTPPIWNYETAQLSFMIPENGTLELWARQ